MSISSLFSNSVSANPWWSTNGGAIGAAQPGAASPGAAPTAAAGPSGTSTPPTAAANGPASGTTNPVQQLGAELQAFLLQLQGAGGTSTATAANGAGAGTAAGGAAPSSGTASTAATGTSSVHHHHHHAGRSGSEQAGEPADAGSGATQSDTGEPGQNTLRLLAADVAKALQSYGGVAAKLSTPSGAAAQAGGLALAA